jgi:hypothetical protein
MSAELPRALRPYERAVLDRLLARDFGGANELRAQAAVATVTGTCGCGCPTVAFAVPPEAPRADLPGPLAPAELSVRPADGGTEDTVILFVADGVIQSLEYVWYGDSPPAEWPSLDRLSDDPNRR